jgi:hypothetical protein
MIETTSFYLGIATSIVVGVISNYIFWYFMNLKIIGEIRVPANNGLVDHEQPFRGMIKRNILRHKYCYYLLVKPVSHAKYFIQVHSGPIEIKSDGSWECEAFIGLATERGKAFTVCLVAFNNEANKFAEYYRDCCVANHGNCVGVKYLPKGVNILHSISVERRP